MREEGPAPDIQSLIADALHHAVQQFMVPSITHIGPINTIGCFLLQHLTGRNYVPVAGSIEVVCGGVPFGIDAHIENVDVHGYYVWIERPCDDGVIERVDFASRYWKDWAKDDGVIWVSDSPPSFVWTLGDDAATPPANYWRHDEVTCMMQRAINDAIGVKDPEGSAARWESAINRAVDYLLESEPGAQFLVDSGIATPLDDKEAYG